MIVYLILFYSVPKAATTHKQEEDKKNIFLSTQLGLLLYIILYIVKIVSSIINSKKY